MDATSMLPPLPLPNGVSSHFIQSPANDLTYHFLSAGRPGDPLVLLLHGFPETSFCWRHVLGPIATKGYYAVAPDTRGSGRTTTAKSTAFTDAGDELRQYQLTGATRDTVVFLSALGYQKVRCLVGHDIGGPLAAWLALMRPDMIERLVVASHAYTGPPILPMNLRLDTPGHHDKSSKPEKRSDIHADLLNLPEPRKHYQWYYAGPEAAADLHCSSHAELRDLLGGYYFLKSASWPVNTPHPLKSWEADELAQMPYYYIMPADASMPEAVRRQLALSGHEADCRPWLNDAELDAMAAEWRRSGFQGALNWYRIGTDAAKWQAELAAYAGKKLEMPTVLVLGRQDWGSYQHPGALESVGEKCVDYRGERWVENAGHWMQQEKPEEVVRYILDHCEDK
ncbi:hypothetical protein ACJ41O_006587 [Fusarium nematophilum]